MGRLNLSRHPVGSFPSRALLGTARSTAENDSVDAAVIDVKTHISTLTKRLGERTQDIDAYNSDHKRTYDV
jgi:hypothetical protein